MTVCGVLFSVLKRDRAYSSYFKGIKSTLTYGPFVKASMVFLFCSLAMTVSMSTGNGPNQPALPTVGRVLGVVMCCVSCCCCMFVYIFCVYRCVVYCWGDF